MSKIISARLAGTIMLAILSLMVVMHILILVEILPADFVWGGQAGGESFDIFLMELIAVIVTLLFGLIVSIKLGFVWSGKARRTINVFLWIICAYFALNTVGNLISPSSLETVIFTPVSILLVLMSLRLAIEN